MFDRHSWWKELRKSLRAREGQDTQEIDGQEALLFKVELGLHLLERLGFTDEPISVLWIVLANPYLPHRTLWQLEPSQRGEIDRCRLLTGFTGRFEWERSLRAYAALPEHFRAFQVTGRPLEEQLVLHSRIPGQHEEHIREYDRILTASLPPRRVEIPLAQAGNATFTIRTRKGTKAQLQATLTSEAVQRAAHHRPLAPLRTPHTARTVHVLTPDRLSAAAENLDNRAQAIGRQLSYSQRLPRLKSLVGDEIPDLVLDGFVNLPGPVGSGKSTLSDLIAACAIEEGWRVALVLSDVMSVLDTTDRLNQLMAEPDRPIAVPLLGRSTLDRNAERFYARDPKPGHWAERWLQTACPLMGMVKLDQISQMEEFPAPGREPCEYVEQSDAGNKRAARKLCPLFHACPSHQAYRDISDAPIWVTTPGALTASNIPLQLDARRIKVGEMIYEQADLVIFDEADAVAAWLDDAFARVISLHGGPNAILDRADELASRPLRERILSPEEERWIRAQRNTLTDLNTMMRQLQFSQYSVLLTSWLGQRYFTAYYLFERLARLLLGLPEISEEEDENEGTRLQQVMSWFMPLIEQDPLSHSEMEEQPATELLQITRLVQGSDFNEIVERCSVWIENRESEEVWELDTILARINQNRRVHIESKQTLAARLAFAMYVALLDRNTRIVLYEWNNQPEESLLDLGDQPYQIANGIAQDILPIPPTGRMFGTYYLRDYENENKGGSLGRLEYTNIGRWYVLNYHRLLADLGIHGPCVLAMSGTGWLPDSQRWHIPHDPCAVLQPSEHQPALAEGSTFHFTPMYNNEGHAIRVSGRLDETPNPLLQLVDEMVKRKALQSELNALEKAGRERPALWADRARLLLLVNSYTQAELVAERLRRTMPDVRVEHLRQTGAEENSDESQGLLRADVENFARDGRQILVAPLNAIGRGYNILNSAGVAGIGSVYFLIRPMRHPDDVQALAGEMNAQTLTWMAHPEHALWTEHSRLVDAGTALRREGQAYWRSLERRSSYVALEREARRSLAAITLGYIVQACGRLLRSGVPFNAYFVDAAWAPQSASGQLDTPRTSLLVALISLLGEYLEQEPGASLYAQFSGLLDTDNLLIDSYEEW